MSECIHNQETRNENRSLIFKHFKERADASTTGGGRTHVDDFAGVGVEEDERGDARNVEALAEGALVRVPATATAAVLRVAAAVSEGERQPGHLLEVLLELALVAVRGHEDDLERLARQLNLLVGLL